MRETGTPKIGSNIMNLRIKRQRITVNLRIRSRKMAISQSHILKIADKKVAYNKGSLYCFYTVTVLQHFFTFYLLSVVFKIEKSKCRNLRNFACRHIGKWRQGWTRWSRVI
jgi:hypothetical protein